jgi:hypothetical protein
MGYGEHGTDGAVKGIGDAGGFIDNKKMNEREAADGIGLAGEADHPAVVFESELVGGAAFLEGLAQADVEVGDLLEELGGLAKAAGEDQDQGAGVEERLDQGVDGDDGGLAGLAGTVEEQARLIALENIGLPGIGVEAEEMHDVERVEHGRLRSG